MKRKLQCCMCRSYLGEIREATLSKAINYICDNCKEDGRTGKTWEYEDHKKPKSSTPDFMKDLLGG